MSNATTLSRSYQPPIRSSGILRTPLFNVVAFSIFWALQIFVTKVAFLRGASVFPFTIQSSLFSIVMLLVTVLPRCRGELRAMQPPILLGVLGANAIHNGLGGFLASIGTAHTSATNAAFTMQCSTVTTTLTAWLWLGEPLTRQKILTVAIIVLGSFLLLTDGLVTVPGIGELLLLLACFSWCTSSVAVRSLVKKVYNT